ncbi:MAG TPA: hypothetical protein VFB73_15940 [Chloroflexota bacterium]|nr:hypothetical protein [Chloroflexota bacterium]
MSQGAAAVLLLALPLVGCRAAPGDRAAPARPPAVANRPVATHAAAGGEEGAMPRFPWPRWLGGTPAALAIGTRARPFALYYGWPSAVNGADGDIAAAAATFARYAVVILGDGLQRDDHPDHARTAAIMRRLQELGTTRVFGYVDLGVHTQNLPLDTILQSAQAWQRLGATGIFLDDAGADFGVDAARRDAAVGGIRRLGLRVILNAHAPDDAFRGQVALGPGDGYLFEAFQVADGHVQPAPLAFAKADRVLALALASGAAVYAVATGPADDPGFATKYAYAWWSALLYGFDYFQYTTLDYGARTAQLAWHDPTPPDLGSRYLEPEVRHAWAEGLHRRATDRGEIRVTSGATLGGAFLPRSE